VALLSLPIGIVGIDHLLRQSKALHGPPIKALEGDEIIWYSELRRLTRNEERIVWYPLLDLDSQKIRWTPDKSTRGRRIIYQS